MTDLDDYEREAHEHLWDTEPVEHVTYTPPEHYDKPWVIRMCCEGNCDALLIDKGRGGGTIVYVREPWFEVTARVKVRHDSAHDAELHVVGLLGAAPRVYPVGVLHAEPCADPTVRQSPEQGGVAMSNVELRRLEKPAIIAWVLTVISFLIVGGLCIVALLIEGHI